MTTKENAAQRVAVAMSGGVDSAVSALLLRQEGADVAGVSMRLYSENDTDPESDDIRDARGVAERLGIPHLVCDLGSEFRRQVIRSFCEEYAAGRTPNPCVVCNQYIKFGALFDFVRAKGYDTLATGHYARLEQDAQGRVRIRVAADTSKDQTYVLWSLKQEVLRHVRFPLGEITKEQARTLAEQNGFVNAHRRDSQDICFIPDGDYVKFLAHYAAITPTPGNYLDTDGAIIGKHKGMLCYTIGQRKGLGMSFGKHMFVCEKNAADNTVTLCDGEELFRHTLTASRVNWISGECPASPVRTQAKIRYAQRAADATVFPMENGRVRVEFDEAQRAIAPGQSVVFYDGEYLLGGGIIDA